MRYKLAVYDWNGTIMNDFLAGYANVVVTFKTFAKHLPIPTAEEYRNEDSPAFYYNHGIPRSITLDDMERIWAPQYNRRFWRGEINPHDGAVELLTFCKANDVPNAIVSSAPGDALNHLVNLEMGRFFEKVIFSAHPKGDALVETLDFFGVKAEDAFYLDDTRDGLAQAKHLGMATIGFTGGFNNKERLLLAEPTFIVDSLREVPALVM